MLSIEIGAKHIKDMCQPAVLSFSEYLVCAPSFFLDWQQRND